MIASAAMAVSTLIRGSTESRHAAADPIPLPRWRAGFVLLRAEALHSCLQMAWSVYRKTVAEALSPPGELILYCGMSIGFEDVTVREDETGRAPLDETVMFVDSLVARLPEGENPKWQSDHT